MTPSVELALTVYDDSPPLASVTSRRPALSKTSENGTGAADGVTIEVADGIPWWLSPKLIRGLCFFVATIAVRPSGVTAAWAGASRKLGCAGLPRPRLRVEPLTVSSLLLTTLNV